MRLFSVSLSAAAMLAVLLLLAACNSTEQNRAGAAAAGANNANSAPAPAAPGASPQQQQEAANAPGDGVRRITTVELKNMIDKGQALVVDVRGDASWEMGHIHGSRHIPLEKVLAEAESLPRDKTIVTYCS